MGVKGLQYYMENHCPSGTRQVSIIELAKRCQEANNRVPVLAVDGMAVLHRLYKMDDLEWLFGGQWRQYVENFRVFVQRFRDEGIELVFFFDGVVPPEKMREWLDRRIEKLKDIRKIFDHLAQYNTCPDDDRLSQLPACMASLIRYALTTVCGCTVINTETDADKEIATYAYNNKSCFAILSQDSDYIIFNTKPYLSISHLKLGNLETLEYDRYALCLNLGININQFPLLACLMGNDFIHVDSLYSFHKQLTHSMGRKRIEKVVVQLGHYIRNWDNNPSVIGRIAHGVGLPQEKLAEGLRYYNILNHFEPKVPAASRFLDPAIIGVLREKHRICQLNSHIYALLNQLSANSSECLEDQKTTGLLPCTVIFRGLRRRMYAILFANCNVEVDELAAVQGVPILMEKVKPEPFLVFGAPQPSVADLWNDRLSRIRWRTVLAAIGVQLSDNTFGTKPHVLVLACLINYLLRNPVGEPRLALWEVHAIIAQAVTPLAENLLAIRNLEVPFVEPRGVHLATIILRGITAIIGLIQVCAEPISVHPIMPWYFFDGKLFHYLYLMAKAGARVEDLVLNDRKAVQEFIQLRMLSISSTYLAEERYERT